MKLTFEKRRNEIEQRVYVFDTIQDCQVQRNDSIIVWDFYDYILF